MRARDRVHPQLLDARALQQSHGGSIGELAEARRRRPCKALGLRRQPLLQRLGHVDVRVQRVDERGSHLLANLVVLDQLARGVAHRLRVQPLEADVAREQAEEDEEHPQDDQDPCGDHSHAAFYRRPRSAFNHTNGVKRSNRAIG